MNILITICARGGSKGVPGKNIKEINGKPLIAYSIDCAKKFSEKYNADIALSTDSIEIKKVAAAYGLTTDYLRPPVLATDQVGKVSVIRDILYYEEEKNKVKYDYVLDLDITSPLRTQNDLDEAYELISRDKDAYNLFSVNVADRNPYFNMVEDIGNGYCQLVKDSDTILSRQAAPKVFDMNASFYFLKKSFFEANFNSAITSKSMYYEIKHICFDVDTPLDFEILAFLLEKKKLDFEI